MDRGGGTFIGLVAFSAVNALALGFLSKKHRKEWCDVGTLEEIKLFPVKSIGGIKLEEATCSYDGLQVTTSPGITLKDRSFIVVNSSMNMVTARQKPKLLTIKCTLSSESILLSAQGMEELVIELKNEDAKAQFKTSVWNEDVEGVDCGEKSSEWLNRFLGTSGYRILRSTDHSLKRNLTNNTGRWYDRAGDLDQVTYQDAYPFMMTVSSSLDDLNNRMSIKHNAQCAEVDSDTFRANFFVETESLPFSEDSWSEIRIGECTFYNIKPCDRCIMTTIDPLLAEKRADIEPLATLRSFRLLYPEFGQSPCFGINLILIKPGSLKRGDKVFVKRVSLCDKE